MSGNVYLKGVAYDSLYSLCIELGLIQPDTEASEFLAIVKDLIVGNARMVTHAKEDAEVQSTDKEIPAVTAIQPGGGVVPGMINIIGAYQTTDAVHPNPQYFQEVSRILRMGPKNRKIRKIRR